MINTIAMFSQGHIVAGIFGLFSSIGWVLQSAGGGILYKRVSSLSPFRMHEKLIKKVWDYKNGHGDITFQAVSSFFLHVQKQADDVGYGSDESCFYQEYHLASISCVICDRDRYKYKHAYKYWY